MQQVFRRVIDKKGKIQVTEVPAPNCGPDQVLVASRYTIISTGTEGATLSKTFPELVKQTLQDPWMRNAVKNLILGASPVTSKNIVMDELTQLRAIGYSGSGVALEVGTNIQGIKPGDRVAFAAQGHAEIVAPSANLTIPIPDEVSFEDAAFVTLGGIAMQGVRRAEIQLGERVAVLGLGLVGQIAAQLVHAAGGHVIGVDINDQRLQDLKQIIPHADVINSRENDPVQGVISLTGGFGADAVIICAGSKEPIIANQAMKMSRKQGRVVFVGIVKMDLERMPFFRNELDLRFSRAYGPGSYDRDYDTGRIDYPQHYIRWTEERNLAEFLRLIREGRVNVQPLIGGTFPVEQAQEAFDKVTQGSLETGIAALLEYPQTQEKAAEQTIYSPKPIAPSTGKIRVGIIGCGNFTRSTHLPNLQGNSNFHISAIATATGVSAASLIEKYGAAYNTSDYRKIINDPEIDAVLIATRHNLHGPIACEALQAGKHVFVEKPAVLTREQFHDIDRAIRDSDRIYMVGYNRRYAPLAVELKSRLTPALPFIARYQVCVPEIPADHWTLNSVEGGGRLIGEAEHFFDFINFLADRAPDEVTARCILLESQDIATQYNFSVEVNYSNHALGDINYTSYGAPGTPRETVTVYQGGKTFILEDYKKLFSGAGKKTTARNQFGDMGHKAELAHFASLIQGKTPYAPQEALAAAEISLSALEWLEKETVEPSSDNTPEKE
ncbi:bi-domain-containing oxidoreductase [Thermodesulfobacteriota bacterium]